MEYIDIFNHLEVVSNVAMKMATFIDSDYECRYENSDINVATKIATFIDSDYECRYENSDIHRQRL